MTPPATATKNRWFQGSKRTPEQPAQTIRALTAAASRIDLADRKQARRQRVLRQGWQLEAWSYRDAIGELRYAVNYLSNCAARMRVYPAAYGDAEGDETDVPISLADAGAPDELILACEQAMKDLGNGRKAIANLMMSLSSNISVAGECFLLGQENPETGAQAWTVRSIDEIVIYDDRYKLREVPMDPQGILGWVDLDPQLTVASRMWNPHPRFRVLADSSLRAIMDDCESLLILRRMIRATGRSRLAGRGLLLIPNELSISVPNDDDDDPQADTFVESLTDAMVTPISDEGVASSVVPVVVRGPGDHLKEVRLVELGAQFDEMSSKNREELVSIIASGLDLPKEVISGVADLNHWSAWQVDDNTFRHHVEPHIVILVECLTQAYLRPYLQNCVEVGTLDPAIAEEWLERVLFWYDPTELVTHPDQTADAFQLHDRLAISDQALRQTAGFSESDKPDDNEYIARLIARQHTWPANLTMEVLHELDPTLNVPPITVAGTVPGVKPGVGGGADVGAPPVAPAPPQTPSTPSVPEDGGNAPTPPPAPSQTPPGPPSTDQPTPSSPITSSGAPQSSKSKRLSKKLVAIDSNLRSRLQVAACAAVMRQLEKAGGRLRSKVSKDESLRSKIAMTRNEHVAAVLGKQAVEATGLTAAGLTQTEWDTFRDQFDSWTSDAQRQALATVQQMAGLEDSDTALLTAQAAMDANRATAWTMLSNSLDQIAQAVLYQPHPNADVDTAVEALNPETVVPTGLIRAALGVAGGGDLGLVHGTGVIPLGTTLSADGTPIGQIGTGDTISNLLTSTGATQRAYTWEHGPSLRSFEPHEDLDGTEFSSFDDPVLANDSGFPDNQFYFPGDHSGCLCDYSPDWLLSDDSSDDSTDAASADSGVSD